MTVVLSVHKPPALCDTEQVIVKLLCFLSRQLSTPSWKGAATAAAAAAAAVVVVVSSSALPARPRDVITSARDS